MAWDRTHLAIIACVVLTVLWGGICEDAQSAGDTPKTNEGLSTASDTLTKEAQQISLDGLSAEELKAVRDSAEKLQFQTEVDRMMKLIINSLYKNKEIFLRELISNASDAIDKIRLLSLTDANALRADPELMIKVKANKEARTLHVQDSGIGMTKEELANNLGTIAKSGTSEFLDKLASSQSTTETTDLIGQFGVGFYSAFLVADRVVVVSKSGDGAQCIWESDGKSFSLYDDPRGDTIARGTEIILHLNEESVDYLEFDRLADLLKKYSQFINFPIYLWGSRVESVEETAEDEDKDDKDSSDSDVKVEEDKPKKPKTVEKTVWDWLLQNENKPIWTRKPSEVTDEEYGSFYKAFTKDYDKYLSKIHFTAEGEISFRSILFIPSRSPMDLFNLNQKPQDSLKLYVRRVFIADNIDDLLPRYLSFLRGIIDSDDLPLNVSRETLQQNKLLKVIRKKIVRKAIEMMHKMLPETFDKFWAEYSVHVKLGIMDDHSNRTRLAKLLRYWTSYSEAKQSSLSEYVSRMPKEQESIYVLTSSSLAEARKSPLVERLINKGFEVIYMVDPIDEYLLQTLTEFDKKKLVNVAKEGIEVDTSEKDKTAKETQIKLYDQLLRWLKEDALKDLIEKAVISERLSDSPCALIAPQHGWTGNMERIMRAQTSQRSEDSSAKYYMGLKKTLEINPRHPLIKELRGRVETQKESEEVAATARLLYDVAVLRSGYNIPDTVEFASRIEGIMRRNLGVDVNAEVEKEEGEEPKPRTDLSDSMKKSDEEIEDAKENISEVKEDTTTPAQRDEASGTAEVKDEL